MRPSKKTQDEQKHQKQNAARWLNAQAKPYRKATATALAQDTAALFLLIGQMYALSALFSDLLLAQKGDNWAAFSGIIGTWLPWFGLCFVARILLLAAKDYALSVASVDFAGRIRAKLLDALAALGADRARLGSDGSIASYIAKAPDDAMGYLRFEAQKKSAVLTPLILLVAVGFANLPTAALLLVTAPLVPVFMIFIGTAVAKKSRAQTKAQAQLSGRFLDWLRGTGTLVRLQAVDVAQKDIAKSAEAYRDRTMSVLKIAFLNNAALEFVSALAIALVAVYLGFGLMGILPWASGKAAVDYQSALFALLLAPEFYAPLRRLGLDYHAKGQAIAAAGILAPFFETPVDRGEDLVRRFDVVLDKASVRSGDRERLPPCCLRVFEGEVVCVMGQSGAGKSTLLTLLLGFCDYQGSAKIGGQEIFALNKAQLRSQIGFLSQAPALLPMSVADNLRLAKADATDDELYAVLDKVGLGDFTRALPKGIRTTLGERGGGLSGGQAQRLAIAQLILQDARLWLLDEPTEHLDEENKRAIDDLLRALHASAPKTVIWVSHEPISWADYTYRVAPPSTGACA